MKSAIRSYPWLGIAVMWGAAFCIACRLTMTPVHTKNTNKQNTVGGKVFGGSRLMLGKFFFLKADEYFHKGRPYIKSQAFDNNIFHKISRKIKPAGHLHLERYNIKEIMPWLWLAIQSDPNNIEFYLVTTFWLAGDAKRPDIALEVLQEAQFNNPFNYEISLAKGQIFLKENKIKEAKLAFDEGIAFWPSQFDPEGVYATYDKRTLLLYRAFICEAEGDNQNAIKALKEILKMFPEQTEWHDRIKTLEKGDEPSLLPSNLWKEMLEKHSKSHESCPREHNDKH
ncbi:tetratricopeptide repeat protein [Verrucomicrobiota bacterium]